ncbi:hypothetical protein MU483_13500 [Staphylococcus aureus]|nr:hypothetical protein [Staphylococcus aureus]MCJ8005683.1 hypothetical protein [Staphylococcus aureus]MCJ8032871.1 hypothetical protein [Staphylococcus aureus]
MKLKLERFSVYEATADEGPSVGASLAIVFSEEPDGVLLVSGSIGITFEHPNPNELTFPQVEELARERILAAL